MPPKAAADIRRFFKPTEANGSKKDPASCDVKSSKTEPEKVEEHARKKSKFFSSGPSAKSSGKGSANEDLNASQMQSPKQSGAAMAEKSACNKGSGTPANKGAKSNKRKLVIESESDDDFQDKPLKTNAKTPTKASITPKKIVPTGKKQKATKPRRKVYDDDEDEDEDFEVVVESSSEDDSMVDLAESEDDDMGISEEIKTGKRSRGGKKQAIPAAKISTKPRASAMTPAKPPSSSVPSAHVKPVPREKVSAKSQSTKKAAEERSSDVQAAIAAVDAAAAKLPPQEALKFSVLAVDPGGGWNQRGSDAPPNPGSKPIPRGHPECLTGKTFVITGVLESLERKEAEDLIKRHNGRVTGSVSGKTSFLVVGHDCGSSKTRANGHIVEMPSEKVNHTWLQAKEKGVKLIDEDGLMALISAAPPPEKQQEPVVEGQTVPALPNAASQLASMGELLSSVA